MKGFFQKYYKALIYGGIITLGLVFMLSWFDFMLVDPAYLSSEVQFILNIVFIILVWLLISFVIHSSSVLKVLGVMLLLPLSGLADIYLKAFNPITIPLIILFWLGVAYLIMPQFFLKYKIAIFSVYGLVLIYFLIFRMMPNYLEEHHQTFVNFMLIPIPIFAALWGYEQWRWFKSVQADKGKAELALLKSQINPHFFFNTLNNLYGLVVEKSDQAPDVVLKLSEMMRYTIYDGREDLVSLDDEITYLENYIDLHKIRYQKKVNIEFHKELDEDLKIAPLLFIILLENSFKHGVEKLTEGAFVRIYLLAKDHHLNFRIENNFEEQPSKKTTGIGLENLRKRLEHIYPGRHELSIEKQAPLYRVNLSIQLS